MRTIASILLRLCGWTVGPFRPSAAKYVLIVAPHTSNWDFIIGRLAFYKIGIPMKVLIKKELFIFPLNFILKAFGGVPVNRQQALNTVNFSTNLLQNADSLALVLTPEGTRKATKNWKKGFYYIAQKAEVPLYIAYIDYKKKKCAIDSEFVISGDIDMDMIKIKTFYQGITAKFPANFCNK
ncbi:MAG: 1-acyl-sn-glycerol-3-phosphate acyltransferase [Bacteroidales bacterium]